MFDDIETDDLIKMYDDVDYLAKQASQRRFVEYNQTDAIRVLQINEKRKLIENAIGVAYLAKCNYIDSFQPVRLWDVIISNHLSSQNIHVPVAGGGVKGEKYEGAFVKPPIAGYYKWMASFDLTSLYPSLIMQYNISPETILHPSTFLPIRPSDVINQTDLYKQALGKAITLNATLAANGSMYRRDKQGVIPFLVEQVFDDRKAAKKLMLKYKDDIEAIKAKIHESGSTSELEAEKKRLSDLHIQYKLIQESLKVLANSVYGAMGSAYFRFFNLHMAEGVTLSGQVTIDTAQQFFNEYLDDVLQVKKDRVVIIDTDSCYLDLSEIVDRALPGKSDAEIVDFLDKLGSTKIQQVMDVGYAKLTERTNGYSARLSMKREAIGAGVIIAKKRYIMKVYDNEGVRFETPEIKVTGLESVQTRHPAWCRSKLEDTYAMLFEKTETEVQDFIKATKAEFYELPVADIASPIGITDLNKYLLSDGTTKKGATQQAKAAAIYNKEIKKRKLTMIHPLIVSGDKIRILPLRLPNPMRQELVGFKDKLPKEFEIDAYVDKKELFEKHYLEPISRVVNVLGWTTEKRYSLEDFF